MSHTIRIQTQFKDKEILKGAFDQLGWNIVENAPCRFWRRQEKYPEVAVNPDGRFDIALKDGAEGVELVSDDMAWGTPGGLKLGNRKGRQAELRRAYSEQAIRKFARKEGRRVVSRDTEKDGENVRVLELVSTS